MSKPDYDAIYRCPCGETFVDDQLAYEIHLAKEHDRFRDNLEPILQAL